MTKSIFIIGRYTDLTAAVHQRRLAGLALFLVLGVGALCSEMAGTMLSPVV